VAGAGEGERGREADEAWDVSFRQK
jgi:hypothetical protein